MTSHLGGANQMQLGCEIMSPQIYGFKKITCFKDKILHKKHIWASKKPFVF